MGQHWVQQRGSLTTHVLYPINDGYKSPCGALSVEEQDLGERVQRINPRTVDEENVCERCKGPGWKR